MAIVRFLFVPVVLAIIAVATDWLPAKMGVPISCAVLLVAAFRDRITKRKNLDLFYVVAAFLFSAAGDYFLSNMADRPDFFVIGIGLYLLAHLGYLGFALANGSLSKPVLGLLLLLFLPYGLIYLMPVIAETILFVAVMVYLLISCVVFASSCGSNLHQPSKALFILGIGLIVLSDTIISFTEFLHFRALNGLILPTYYLAHLSISCALLMRLNSPEKARTDAA